jgi:hypothetical protein
MAEYLIQDVTLMNIANVIRAKTGKQDAISASDFASEIGTIQAFEAELPVLDAAYPKDVNLTVIKGDTVSATFNVVFTAHGKPAEYEYQWYVDGVAVEGANSSIFVKNNLSNTINHNIYCEITNEAGTVTTRIATLKVTQCYTPVLNSSYPADATVTYRYGKSTSATFKVQIATAGVPTSYTYQWYVDDKAVSGATSATYTISGLNADATKNVYCKVTNAAGTVQSRTATLNVSQLELFLYNEGDTCEDVTGGWSDSGKRSSSNSVLSYSSSGLTFNTTNMLVKIASSTSSTAKWQGSVHMGKDVDFTKYSTLHFLYDCTRYDDGSSGSCWGSFTVSPRSCTYYEDSALAIAAVSQNVTSYETTIDVSNINTTSDVYIGVGCQKGDDIYVWIKKIWLEP